MNSTPCSRTKRFSVAVLLAGSLTMAGAAEAGDRRDHKRHKSRPEAHEKRRNVERGAWIAEKPADLRDARRLDRKLDRRGEVIDHQLDFLAFVAALSGEHRLARELDRTGDRIERRFDRRGDRVLRSAKQHIRSGKHRTQSRSDPKRTRHHAKRRDDQHQHKQPSHLNHKSRREDRHGNTRHGGPRLDRDEQFALHRHLGR
jgi:hypothetical protein